MSNVIDINTRQPAQCGARESYDNAFFRTGYPCTRPRGHEGTHVTRDGAFMPEDAAPDEATCSHVKRDYHCRFCGKNLVEEGAK